MSPRNHRNDADDVDVEDFQAINEVVPIDK